MLDRAYTRSLSLATADLTIATGIKTSIATAATQQTYSGAALNGTTVTSNVAYPKIGGFNGVASWPCFSSTSNAGSYTAGSTITFVGTYNGVAATSVATITGTDGGQTAIAANNRLDTVSSVIVAAQANTGGAFTFGWSGASPGRWTVGGTNNLKRWVVVARASGNVHVENAPGQADTIALLNGSCHYCYVSRIYADTAVAVTVYEE